MCGDPELCELTKQEKADLDDAARMLLGMTPPPIAEPEEGEPEAA